MSKSMSENNDSFLGGIILSITMMVVFLFGMLIGYAVNRSYDNYRLKYELTKCEESK